MDAECKKCGWNLPQPTLADAISGFRECTNCEDREVVPEQERLEAAWGIEQRLHLLENAVFPGNK